MILPPFLVRGLSCIKRGDDGDWTAHYRNEADLRDSLATIWWLYGADVRTEVKVPNCGRIDVLVKVGRHSEIFEIKREITTPSAALAAFRQAHSYLAFLRAASWRQLRPELRHITETETFSATVAAAHYDDAAAEDASDAYDDVWGRNLSTAFRYASQGVLSFRSPDRPSVVVVAERAHSLRSLADHLDLAAADLTDASDGQAIAIGDGQRISRRNMTNGHWSAHLAHGGENAAGVNASAARENRRYVALSPYLATGLDTEQAMKAWQAANPGQVLS